MFETMKNVLFPVLNPRETLTLLEREKKKKTQEMKGKVEFEMDGGILLGFSRMDGGRLGAPADGAARGTEHNLASSVWPSKVSLLLLQEFSKCSVSLLVILSPTLLGCVPAGPGSPGFGENSPAVLDPDIPGGKNPGRAGMGGRSISAQWV